MANIGSVRTGSENYALAGRVNTRAFSGKIGLRRFVSNNPMAPKFHIMAQVPGGGAEECGALFGFNRKSDGKRFYKGFIHASDMRERMDITLFAVDGVPDGSAYHVTRDIENRRRRSDGEQNDAAQDTPQGDGLGESDAGEPGSAVNEGGKRGGRGRNQQAQREETPLDDFIP